MLIYNESVIESNSKVNIGIMLTKRQKQVLDFIKSFQKKKGYSPSLEEIKKHLKLSSVSTIHHHVQALEDLGFLKKEENQPRTIEVYEKEQMIKIPLLGVIAAGQPIEAVQEGESIAVSKSKLPRTGDFFALRVVGDSMVEESINDGDVVLVRQQTVAENGQKVVALINNTEATLKKYYKEQGHIRLQPANRKLEPIIIKRPRNLVLQGIVIDIIRGSLGASLPKPREEAEERIKRKKIGDLVGQIIEGNCLEVMKEIPPKSVDMILCDLPYGTTQNRWDSPIPLDQLWAHYERVIKDDGVIALTAQGLFSANLILSNPKLFKYKITWVKSKSTNFLNAKKQPLRKHEDVLIFYNRQPSYNPQMSKGEPYNKGFRKNQLTGSYGDFKTVEVKSNGERYPTDVIYFKTAESEGPVYHPTQKPVELGRYLIKTFTNPRDIVLDNTCGSGSFLVAAVLEGRKFIGIEKNQEVYLFKKKKVDYIEVCRQRVKEAQEQYQAEENKLRLL